MDTVQHARRDSAHWQRMLVLLCVLGLSMLPLGQLVGCEAAGENTVDLGSLRLDNSAEQETKHYLIVNGTLMTHDVQCQLRDGHLYFNNRRAHTKSEVQAASVDEQRETTADTQALKIPFVAELVQKGVSPRDARGEFNQRVTQQLDAVREVLARARVNGGDRIALARLQLDATLVDTTTGQKHSARFRSECDGFTLFFHGQGWIGLDCPSQDGTLGIATQEPSLSIATAKSQVKMIQAYFANAQTAVVILDPGGDIYARDNDHAKELANEIDLILSGRTPSDTNSSTMRLPRNVAQQLAAYKRGAGQK